MTDWKKLHRYPHWFRVFWGLLLFGSAACSSSLLSRPTVEGPLSMGEELRIGILISEQNWRNIYRSNRLIDASYLMRDRINACGGVNRAPVSIVIAEAEATEKTENEAIRTLINEHRVHGIIAQFSSQNPTSAIEQAIQSETPLLVASIDVWQSMVPYHLHSNYWGYIIPSQQQRIRAWTQFIRDQGYSQTALIVSDLDDIDRWQRQFVQSYRSIDGRVINVEEPIVWQPSSESPAQSNNRDVSSDEAVREQIDQLQQLIDQNRIEIAAQAQQVQAETISNSDDADTAQSSESGGTAIAVMVDAEAGADLLTTMVSIGWQSEEMPIFWYDPAGLESILDRIIPEAETDIQPAESEILEAIAGMLGIKPAANGEGFQEFNQAWDQRLEHQATPQAAKMWDGVGLFALAAHQSGQNSRSSIFSGLPQVSNPPGIPLTNICEGFEQLQAQEIIDFQGASSSLDLNPIGEVPATFDVWQLNADGDITILDSFAVDAQN